MDAYKVRAQAGRMEVVETGRRRRWSEDEKLRIVLESLAAPRLVAATARRHGISRSLLTRWRGEFRPERNAPSAAPTGFVPAIVVPEMNRAPAASSAGRMVIVVGKGRRVIVDAGVDAAALGRVLDVLERR